MTRRFRGFLPVVVDMEMGGFDCTTDAVLEIGAVILGFDAEGRLGAGERVGVHVSPFEGARIMEEALKVNKIDPFNPLRHAVDEREALDLVFAPIRRAMKEEGCRRAVLVGHNAHFDLGFLNAMVARTGHKRNPFHPFTVFDTATLSGLAYGQTVLAKACAEAGLEWDGKQAHSALYDAEMTAMLYCGIVNAWSEHIRPAQAFLPAE
ncbi:MAG TPA: ribonuclease T [Chromatiales bacterium]|nr:ribonuclease T [Chromatiales bacterium]